MLMSVHVPSIHNEVHTSNYLLQNTELYPLNITLRTLPNEGKGYYSSQEMEGRTQGLTHRQTDAQTTGYKVSACSEQLMPQHITKLYKFLHAKLFH